MKPWSEHGFYITQAEEAYHELIACSTLYKTIAAHSGEDERFSRVDGSLGVGGSSTQLTFAPPFQKHNILAKGGINNMAYFEDHIEPRIIECFSSLPWPVTIALKSGCLVNAQDIINVVLASTNEPR